jgi:hypothetical protein
MTIGAISTAILLEFCRWLSCFAISANPSCNIVIIISLAYQPPLSVNGTCFLLLMIIMLVFFAAFFTDPTDTINTFIAACAFVILVLEFYPINIILR